MQHAPNMILADTMTRTIAKVLDETQTEARSSGTVRAALG